MSVDRKIKVLLVDDHEVVRAGYRRLLEATDDIVVIAGGVIPKQDYEYLYNAGVKCIFGPGSPIPVCAREVLDAVNAAQT